MKLSTKSILLGGALAALILPAAAQAQSIHQRKENQQDRIAQGVKSGQLTPRETARIEHKEAKLNQETRRMRAANGGSLTPAEKAKVTRQQNHLSRDIYHQKKRANGEKASGETGGFFIPQKIVMWTLVSGRRRPERQLSHSPRSPTQPLDFTPNPSLDIYYK